MMTEEVKFPKATLGEYGYKDYRALAMVWKVVKIILVVFSIFMLYLSVIVIAIQSFNSSASTTEFQGFTFDNYIQMFSKRSLTNSIKNTFLVSITATLIA
ncbi:MAG: hypothetical protein K2F56_04700, partial [Anaeroplasmataceae bacterium]|nr:hypothetical protein [Anaeroplasmataceae bacterium]